MVAEHVLTLPDGYSTEDVLEFHGRDPLSASERAGPDGFVKALLIDSQPALLSVRFLSRKASVRLALGGGGGRVANLATPAIFERMLGVRQPIEAFMDAFGGDEALGPLLRIYPGLRVPLTATPFEALSWAITGQQISLPAALSLRRRLVATCNRVCEDGLLCYPDAATILTLGLDRLRQAGFSQAKAATLLAVAEAVLTRALPLDDWLGGFDPATARAQLLAMKGIGPWTADYTLLRGYGWLDGSLHGDAAVRRGLRRLLRLQSAPTAEFCADWLARFSPWRALVAAHLWRLAARGEG